MEKWKIQWAARWICLATESPIKPGLTRALQHPHLLLAKHALHPARFQHPAQHLLHFPPQPQRLRHRLHLRGIAPVPVPVTIYIPVTIPVPVPVPIPLCRIRCFPFAAELSPVPREDLIPPPKEILQFPVQELAPGRASAQAGHVFEAALHALSIREQGAQVADGGCGPGQGEGGEGGRGVVGG
ncbi:hypothetical protein PMIN05_000134 [Paraphaeosphaeria minitans]